MPSVRSNDNTNTIMPDFIVQLQKTWSIALLTVDDTDAMTSFIKLFNDFFQLCEGEDGSAITILHACPSLKDIYKDKFVLGLYNNTLLIGVIDILCDYPENGILTIGYLLIHPDYRNRGIGSKFITDLKKIISPDKLRCIVQKQNKRALEFWKSNGFSITGQKEDQLGNLVNINLILEK